MNAPLPELGTSGSIPDEIDIGRLLSALWRGKLWIFLFGLLTLFAGVYYAYGVVTPVYSTTAVVVQETDKKPVVDFSGGLGEGLGGLGGGLGGDQSGINTQIEIMRSRDLLEKLVAELDLIADPEFNASLRPPPSISIGKIVGAIRKVIGQQPAPERKLSPDQIRDTVVDSLRSALSVSNIRQSYVYNITATTESAIKSTKIVNTLASLYISNQLNEKRENNLQATVWLADRLGQLRVDLQNAESKVKDFNAQTDLINADTLAALSRQVKELRERVDEVRTARSNLNARIAQMKSAAEDGDPREMADVAQDRVLNRLFGELNLLTTAGRESFDARFFQLIAQYELERDRMQAQITALEKSIAEQEQETDRQSIDLISLQQLQREAEASRLLYEYFLSRLKETSAQSGIQTPDSRLLSRAVEPLRPSAPRKSVILIVSLMLGLMAGATVIILRELTRNNFRAADELETFTGYRVLGQIPKIPALRRNKYLRYLTQRPSSAEAEAVRSMRTSVLLSDSVSPPQVIMSTSSIPNEGRVTQSQSLTYSLASLGKSVLLIEGDVRKRELSKSLQATGQGGLISVLEGNLSLNEAVSHETTLNADILTSEEPATNAADLFSSQAFADLLKEARKKYDYIVIDAPPVLAVPDARIIGKQVDTTLYTVRWKHTTQRQVSQGLKALSQVRIPIAGLVLGQIESKELKRDSYIDHAYAGYHGN